jgi:hypothetical protein
VVSYLIICAKLGYRLPGVNTIPEQIAANKGSYYTALEKADHALEDSKVIDVSELEGVIDAYLATQLLDVHDKAAGVSVNRNAIANLTDDDAEGGLSESSAWSWRQFIARIERHPVLVGGAITIIAAVLAIIFT